jgi:hypothetical protein
MKVTAPLSAGETTWDVSELVAMLASVSGERNGLGDLRHMKPIMGEC